MKCNISKITILIIILVFAVFVGFCSYWYIIKPIKTASTNTQNTEEQSALQDLGRLKYEVYSKFAFVDSFDFELIYATGVGTTTPFNRTYMGTFTRNSKNSAYDFKCDSFKVDVTTSDEEIKKDLSMVLFDEDCITDIKRLAAGYEVYVKDPDTGFEGQYTIILENYIFKEIIGYMSRIERNPNSDYDLAGGSLDEYENYNIIIKIPDK